MQICREMARMAAHCNWYVLDHCSKIRSNWRGANLTKANYLSKEVAFGLLDTFEQLGSLTNT